MPAATRGLPRSRPLSRAAGGAANDCRLEPRYASRSDAVDGAGEGHLNDVSSCTSRPRSTREQGGRCPPRGRDLRVPPSNHFEKLRGNLAGFYSVRVNSQWRLIFRWDGNRGKAEGVYLDDHSYR